MKCLELKNFYKRTILFMLYLIFFESIFSGNISIASHKNLDDRIKASQILLESKSSSDNYEIFVDLMDNKACHQYAALPERLYVILDGKVIYEGKQGPFGYSLSGVEGLITKYSK